MSEPVQTEKILKYLVLKKSIADAKSALKVTQKEFKNLELDIIDMLEKGQSNNILVAENKTLIYLKKSTGYVSLNPKRLLNLMKYVDDIDIKNHPEEWVGKIFEIRDKVERKRLMVTDYVDDDDEDKDKKMETDEEQIEDDDE